MKTGIILCFVLLVSGFTGSIFAGTEGPPNVFYGNGAGANTTGDSNTFIGLNAGYSNTTGSENTFLGDGAGYSNTEGGNNTFVGRLAGSSNTTGMSNTFVGGLAGNDNTTGDGNTFLGSAAGFSNTTGHDNIFLGSVAGFYNTSGFANSFIGDAAGYFNTTGYDNTFLGNGAGFSNTEGHDNIFIGLGAGNSNATGFYNNFLGNGAGNSNTIGYNNTFLGNHTGNYNTTGCCNTFLGNETGYSNTAGYYNTFLGNGAGFSNTTGYYNTYLGMSAGVLNTTGFGNVFIGYLAGYSQAGSNRLYIANSDTTTPLIYGEFDSKKLTINGNLEVIGPNNGLVHLSNITTDETTKVSRMVLHHYSNAQLPVYVFGAASTATDNFVAVGGGNTIGNAATQVDVFTAPNTTTPVGSPRITIKGNGYVGIGTQSPSYPLQMAGGAYSDGGSWINGSSREYKDNIRDLTTEEAMSAFHGLNPVAFTYKAGAGEQHIGFIAEDVPDLVATKGRKGLSPMDIVAVLTKVVQEQQKTNQEQQTVIKSLTDKLAQLEAKIEDLQTRGNPLSMLSQK